MSVISIPGEDTWLVSRWAFSELLDRARKLLDADPTLTVRLDAAEANDGLHLGRLPPEEAERLVAAVSEAARQLASEIPSDSSDARRTSFREELGKLEDLLSRQR
jgi:hypothetical protein